MAKKMSIQELVLHFFEPHIKTFIEEKGYDRLHQQEWWQEISAIRKQHPISGDALIGLLEIIIQKWEPKSPIANLASDIAIDFPAELQRRLIDGLKGVEFYTDFFSVLLKPEFKEFLVWWHTQDQKTKNKYFSAMIEMSKDELERFLSLSLKEKEKLCQSNNRQTRKTKSVNWKKVDKAVSRNMSHFANKITSHYGRKKANGK